MTDRPPLTSRTLSIVLVVALAQFMQMLDASVIAIALPPMAKDFAVSPVAVGFGITVYVLAASIFIPASAWLADRIGARTLFIAAVAGFAATSLLCGLSGQLWQFIGARALQGISGALMAPVGQLILLRTVERSELLRVINLTSAPMLVAPVLGPPLGGLLATWIGWEWIFFINLPAGVLVIAMALKFLPNPKGDRRPFDALGFTLNALALAPLLWGLGELASHDTPRAVAWAAVVTGLAIGALALRHARRAEHPLLSPKPFRHETFRRTTGSGTLLIRLPITANIFVLPILLQGGFGMTAFVAGLLFLVHSAGDLMMKLFTTRAYSLFGYRRMLIGSTAVMAFGIASAALFTRTTPIPLIGAVLFVSGAFRSFLMTGLSTLAYADVDPSEMPSASVLTQVVLQMATALGVSFSSLLLEFSPVVLGQPASAVPTPEACRLTLAVMAAMALFAIPLFRRLPKDAGAELSGRRAQA